MELPIALNIGSFMALFASFTVFLGVLWGIATAIKIAKE